MPVTNTTIRAANGLTARWAAATEGKTVFSAPGTRPLPDGQAADAGRESPATIADVRGLEQAVGPYELPGR